MCQLRPTIKVLALTRPGIQQDDDILDIGINLL
jgi:hypothetical protein